MSKSKLASLLLSLMVLFSPVRAVADSTALSSNDVQSDESKAPKSLAAALPGTKSGLTPGEQKQHDCWASSLKFRDILILKTAED